VEGATLPWPPVPTRCSNCGLYIGRNRATAEPVASRAVPDEDGPPRRGRVPPGLVAFLMGRPPEREQPSSAAAAHQAAPAGPDVSAEAPPARPAAETPPDRSAPPVAPAVPAEPEAPAEALPERAPRETRPSAAAGRELAGAGAHCPHCEASLDPDAELPWPPEPTRCPECTRWIGRRRAVARPVAAAAQAPAPAPAVTPDALEVSREEPGRELRPRAFAARAGASVRRTRAGLARIGAAGFGGLSSRLAGLRMARRSRRARAGRQRGLKATGGAMLAVGVLILAYGVVTLVWQDPLTALQATRAQHRADIQFRGLLRNVRRATRTQQRHLITSWIANQAAEFNVRTPPGYAIGKIDIPRIGAHFTVVQGTDEASLEKGPAHYVETPLPGAQGHWTVGIAGHRTTYLAPFRHIDELERGDSVVVQMPYARFRYSVLRTRIVDAGDRSALAADSAITGREPYNQLALTACHPPFSATQRIIVYAKLRKVIPVGARSKA
ncbi:MAG: sortase, partial [Thermoleophilaceae bacterium]|nr:sortase [Thermoleophilaceae bacterium]